MGCGGVLTRISTSRVPRLRSGYVQQAQYFGLAAQMPRKRLNVDKKLVNVGAVPETIPTSPRSGEKSGTRLGVLFPCREA